MSKQSNAEYFALRAVVEHGMSDAASNPRIASIHKELAERYAELAAELAERPKLHVATG